MVSCQRRIIGRIRRKRMVLFLGYALLALLFLALAALALRILWAPADPPESWP